MVGKYFLTIVLETLRVQVRIENGGTIVRGDPLYGDLQKFFLVHRSPRKRSVELLR